MEKGSVRKIVALVFRALTLAMGVAVVALSCLGSLETGTAITLLDIRRMNGTDQHSPLSLEKQGSGGFLRGKNKDQGQYPFEFF